MKKSNLMWLGLCLFLCLFIACSDDNNGGGGGNTAYPSATLQATEYGAWTYFDFATGTARSLKIKGQEGAATGIYYGDLSSEYITNSDSLQMIITRHTADSVTITLPEVMLMGRGTAAGDTLYLFANAKAEKSGNKWNISGANEICPVEKDGSVTNYVIGFNGTIGTTKGEAVAMTVFLLPKAMYDAMGDRMNFGGTYAGEVDESYIYEVDGDETSFEWDLAFHKYDIRTNGGSVVKTDKTNLDDITSANIPSSGFTEDKDGSVYADMRNMMSGFVGYQYCKLNDVLGEWVTKTATGTMPPYTYKLINNVFILKTGSGKFAKIQFYDTTNDKGEAVYPTFNYEYPVK